MDDDMLLENQRCKACEGDTKPLSSDEINSLITQIPEWKINKEKTAIFRLFKFKNFFQTMNFVNAVAYIANQEGHHPDFNMGYNYCRISFMTHAIEGLSHNDFICARKIDCLFT